EAPGYIGAHPPRHARVANLDDTKRLLDAACGLTRIVTLAPERDPGFAVTRFLADRGIVVAAGHCDPTLDQLRGAIDNGLTLFTHLGNGCPLRLHRHDNIIQRVLSLAPDSPLHVTFIADGVHVPLHALGNYLDRVGPERAIVVSDAISAASLGPGGHTLGDQAVHVTDDLATWAPDRSHLIGSACPMSRMIDNLAGCLRLSPEHVRALTHDNPRRLLCLGDG
ncbi:MAG: N-acetylglucosamine-6-phosphate deacetylase, partial [Planctomycetota bacterium]